MTKENLMAIMMTNLMTASGMEQEKPRPDQAGVGVRVSPAGCREVIMSITNGSR